MTRSKYAWIHSPLTDGLFILLPPFLTLLIVALMPQAFLHSREMPVAAWVVLIIMIDVAHVYSTIYRTYFDKESLARDGALLFNIPLICLVAGVILYSINDMLFWRVMAYTAVFHFVRQQYGFMRIYARNDNDSRFFRNIDSLVIYTATIYPILYWHVHEGRNFDWFVEGDFVYFKSNLIATLSTVCYVVIFLAYITKEAYCLLKKGSINFPKNMVIAGTALSWYCGIVYFNGDLAFTALNVISHGVPYMALIWFYGNKKYERKSSDAPILMSKLFRVYSIPIFLLIIILLAYLEEGLWDGLVWRDHTHVFALFRHLPHVNSHSLLSVVVPLLALPQLTHYVLDGFIWKISKDKYNWKGPTLES